LKLVDNFYPEDFNEKKMHYLRSQLKYYQINLIYYKSFQHMSIIFKLCRGLMKTNKLQHNHLINKLITLHVFSTATKKWAFLAMKHVKNIFHNKIKKGVLSIFYNDLHWTRACWRYLFRFNYRWILFHKTSKGTISIVDLFLLSLQFYVFLNLFF
jgi:hypothetical protein